VKPPAGLADTGLLRELLHIGLVVEDLEAARRDYGVEVHPGTFAVERTAR
jgi:hypothetical protein